MKTAYIIGPQQHNLSLLRYGRLFRVITSSEFFFVWRRWTAKTDLESRRPALFEHKRKAKHLIPRTLPTTTGAAARSGWGRSAPGPALQHREGRAGGREGAHGRPCPRRDPRAPRSPRGAHPARPGGGQRPQRRGGAGPPARGRSGTPAARPGREGRRRSPPSTALPGAGADPAGHRPGRAARRRGRGVAAAGAPRVPPAAEGAVRERRCPGRSGSPRPAEASAARPSLTGGGGSSSSARRRQAKGEGARSPPRSAGRSRGPDGSAETGAKAGACRAGEGGTARRGLGAGSVSRQALPARPCGAGRERAGFQSLQPGARAAGARGEAGARPPPPPVRQHVPWAGGLAGLPGKKSWPGGTSRTCFPPREPLRGRQRGPQPGPACRWAPGPRRYPALPAQQRFPREEAPVGKGGKVLRGKVAKPVSWKHRWPWRGSKQEKSSCRIWLQGREAPCRCWRSWCRAERPSRRESRGPGAQDHRDTADGSSAGPPWAGQGSAQPAVAAAQGKIRDSHGPFGSMEE